MVVWARVAYSVCARNGMKDNSMGRSNLALFGAVGAEALAALSGDAGGPRGPTWEFVQVPRL
jgi:hypothetical protein